MLGVELIAIKTAVSTPMVMGNISTLIDGNISNIGSRLREVINITYYINSSFFIR